ncbi:hypothetical protein CR513_11969, partial [Mucuna pruriens]
MRTQLPYDTNVESISLNKEFKDLCWLKLLNPWTYQTLKYGYLYLIHYKSQSLDVFKSFNAEVELQLGKKIKVIKFDHNGEYYGRRTSSAFCGELPNMNNVAERRNQTLKDMVRKLLWGEILKTVVYILNKVPSKAVNKTPMNFGLEKGQPSNNCTSRIV